MMSLGSSCRTRSNHVPAGKHLTILTHVELSAGKMKRCRERRLHEKEPQAQALRKPMGSAGRTQMRKEPEGVMMLQRGLQFKEPWHARRLPFNARQHVMSCA